MYNKVLNFLELNWKFSPILRGRWFSEYFQICYTLYLLLFFVQFSPITQNMLTPYIEFESVY